MPLGNRSAERAHPPRRLLLVTQRAPVHPGGATARWRSLCERLPEFGWEADVLASSSGLTELASTDTARQRVAQRDRAMGVARRTVTPAFARAGLEPPPLSTLWAPAGALRVRRELARHAYDAVVATAPPMVALPAALAGLRGRREAFVVDLRDLWAGNPAYDLGGPVIQGLQTRVLRRAARIVVCTPEAADDIRDRHPDLADRVVVVPNGFEPELLAIRTAPPAINGRRVLIHSGLVTRNRPLRPLLDVLARDPYRSAFRLRFHGTLAEEARADVHRFEDRVAVDLVPPGGWREAMDEISGAHAGLVVQGLGAGNATAVASKAYEYLALGRPVLCVGAGQGGTERLLKRLGADQFCARMEDPESIATALDRLLAGPIPDVRPERLEPYSRAEIAAGMAAVLDETAAAAPRRDL